MVSSLTYWDCKTYLLGFENLLFGIAKLTFRVRVIPYKMGAKPELCTGTISQGKQRAFPNRLGRRGFDSLHFGCEQGLSGPVRLNTYLHFAKK
jgi:hypothetical protein